MIENLDALTVRDLQRVHPLWVLFHPRWVEIQDVRAKTVRERKQLYLPKGHIEPDAEYAKRLEMSRFIPEAPTARNRVLGSLFAEQPDRDGLPEQLEEWGQAVDRTGRSWPHYLESQIAPVMADFGTAFCLVDRPEAPADAAPRSRADEQEMGLDQPFLVTYSPLSVRNWEIDSRGRLAWLLIVEEGWAQSGPLGVRTPQRTYRIFDRTHWHRITTQPNDPEQGLPALSWLPSGEVDQTAKAGKAEEQIVGERASGEHGSPGVVPVAPFLIDCVAELIGESLISTAVELDLKRYALESDQSWALFIHGHPQLVIRTREDLSQVRVGTSAYLKLNPEDNEDAFYASPGAESFQAREREIQQVKTDTYRHTGADPTGVVMGTEGGAAAVSGVSRVVAYRTSEGRHVGRLRDRLEEGENTVWRIVGDFLSSPPEDHAVNWPNTIDDEPPGETLDNFQVAKRALRSDTAIRMHEKRATRKLLGEVPKDEWAVIEQEIDSQETRQPLMPDLTAFGADDESEDNDG